MAYIVITGKFPGHKASEIGKRFLDLPKLLNFVKTEHVFNTAEGKYRFFSIYEITEEEKYFEGLKAIYTRFIFLISAWISSLISLFNACSPYSPNSIAPPKGL